MSLKSLMRVVIFILFIISNQSFATPIIFDPSNGFIVDMERSQNNPLLNPQAVSPGPDYYVENGDNVSSGTAIELEDGKIIYYDGGHSGDAIRRYEAQNPMGPFTYTGDALLNRNIPNCEDHIATPAITKHGNTYYMLFHCIDNDVQKTQYATSTDGNNWTVQGFAFDGYVSDHFNARAFYVGDLPDAAAAGYQWCALFRNNKKEVELSCTKNAAPINFNNYIKTVSHHINMIRHIDLEKRGNALVVYYTNMDVASESLYLATIDTTLPLRDWEMTSPKALLGPEKDYEGIQFNCSLPTHGGTQEGGQCMVQSPSILNHSDGNGYLYYVGEGERQTNVAKVTYGDAQPTPVDIKVAVKLRVYNCGKYDPKHFGSITKTVTSTETLANFEKIGNKNLRKNYWDSPAWEGHVLLSQNERVTFNAKGYAKINGKEKPYDITTVYDADNTTGLKFQNAVLKKQCYIRLETTALSVE